MKIVSLLIKSFRKLEAFFIGIQHRVTQKGLSTTIPNALLNLLWGDTKLLFESITKM
jgi:hypothetical protein